MESWSPHCGLQEQVSHGLVGNAHFQVFYVKTTNPQAIMHLETDSFLGPTLNPYNRLLTAGGSSGGEGALIGIGASPIGVGTDIGGSIRNPAAVNGIYGFKATSLRLPKAGNFVSHFDLLRSRCIADRAECTGWARGHCGSYRTHGEISKRYDGHDQDYPR